MLRDLLVGTQDKSLHVLCQPLCTNANFHLFDDINNLLLRIAELREGIAVFVDVEWPNSQNGYNVAREVKRRNDGSKTLLITDRIDDVKLHWCAKVNAEMVERAEPSFLGRLAPFAKDMGFSIPDNWQHHFKERTTSSSSSSTPVAQAESELERILGPMGPLLLRDALADTKGNLPLALMKVSEFGTTAAERTQVANLSSQFHQGRGNK